jgi:hypothetical protein
MRDLDKELEILKLQNENLKLSSEVKEVSKVEEVNTLVVYILWIFLGLLGAHHYYIAYKRGGYTYWISGFMMTITLGGFYVWWLLDVGLNLVYIKEADKTILEKTKGV